MTLPYNMRDYHFKNQIDIDTKRLRFTLDWNKIANLGLLQKL